jgi:hypothetical protein
MESEATGNRPAYVPILGGEMTRLRAKKHHWLRQALDAKKQHDNAMNESQETPFMYDIARSHAHVVESRKVTAPVVDNTNNVH